MWKRIILIGLIPAGLVAFGLAIMFLSGSLSMLTAPFRGEVDKVEQIEGDGGYRIDSNDKFYDLCGDISAKQDEIELLQSSADSAATEEERQRLQGAVTANQIVLAQMVEDYNADARNTYTKGQFRNSDLPYQIDPQEDVQCGS